ncbi:MAG: nuclear transport factor 2 family protein [Minwuiales bacterium]|nr:nuclear transport factor 2 family protein [Minwuiales bacterium]
MTGQADTAAAERDIAALCRALAVAHADKDADAIVDCYAADALIYSLAPPLGARGMDRDGVAAWLATWDGPIRVDAAEVDLTVRGDVAYATALNRMRGRKTDGEDIDLWFRTTLCFGRAAGRWRIVHDHASVPFLMDGSYRAALDLKP